MKKNIIKNMKNELDCSEKQIKSVLDLLEEKATIPFIARYRKEVTGGLDENKIKQIDDVYQYQINLLERKQTIIKLISEKGLLTKELEDKINASKKLVDLEDIYRPYKEKKKTKATEAIKLGLEPLAKIFMSFPTKSSIEEIVSNFKCNKDITNEEKITGAQNIISEWISDNDYYRKSIRENILKKGFLISKKKPTAEDEKNTFEIYYDYKEKIQNVKPYKLLAINRGEKLKILNVSIAIEKENIINFLNNKVIKNNSSISTNIVKEAIEDSYKRLIFPSIEREIRSIMLEEATITQIDSFSKNLENLLMIPPVNKIRVLGFDPAFRTGCKLAVLDYAGEVLNISVIYPHEPKNKIEESKKIVLDLIKKYNIDVVAIGNGTASRESEKFISELIKQENLKTKYIIVNEAGASVYSASNLAQKEFPNLDVSERSAISIGRRLQDPLAELVKIDPKSIGVGLYQHDIKAKQLDESLKFTVSSVVNRVGININTASENILSYISGLNKKAIEKILSQRLKLGSFKTREEIKKIKGLSDKIYEQSIGFIRINDGENILDKTNIHPESYEKVYKLLNYLNINEKDIGTSKIKEILNDIDENDIIEKIDIDLYTLKDIISSLIIPFKDPREAFNAPILRSDILTIEDLSIGEKISGVIRNVVPFGAFVDIGLKNDGMVHISEISNSFIKDPSDILSIGDVLEFKVLKIDKDNKKVSLSLK